MSKEKLIIAIDTETTGFGHVGHSPRVDGVVQVGYAYRAPGGHVRTWYKNCNPGAALLAGGRAREALGVNLLTEAEILAANPADDVAREFMEDLRRIEGESGAPAELRAYNRDFDEPFLRPKPWAVPRDKWGRCIMKAAAVHLDGPEGRWPKLPDAVRRLGLMWPDGQAHNAAVDSHAALLVDEVLRKSGK